eukprot:Hpha_TRINITY_DN9049_c0_g1::TRINITY_DN9049_c0_g1_i1::g.141725::m.141725
MISSEDEREDPHGFHDVSSLESTYHSRVASIFQSKPYLGGARRKEPSRFFTYWSAKLRAPGDTKERVDLKVGAMLTAIAALTTGIFSFGTYPVFDAYGVGMLMLTTFGAGSLVLVCGFKWMSLDVWRIFLGMLSLAIFLIDWTLAATPGTVRFWSAQVLVTDLCLVANVGPQFTRAIVICTVVWLTVVASETAMAWGMSKVDFAGGNTDYMEQSLDCAEPPCPRGWLSFFRELSGYFTVFLVDFGLTRGFAEGQRQLQHQQKAALKLGSEVARLIAILELDEADALLQKYTVHEYAFVASFAAIVVHLRELAVYLPDALQPRAASHSSPGGLKARRATEANLDFRFTGEPVSPVHEEESSAGIPVPAEADAAEDPVSLHHDQSPVASPVAMGAATHAHLNPLHIQEGGIAGGRDATHRQRPQDATWLSDVLAGSDDGSECSSRSDESSIFGSMAPRSHGPPRRTGFKSQRRACVFFSLQYGQWEKKNVAALSNTSCVLLSHIFDTVSRLRGRLVQFDAIAVQSIFFGAVPAAQAAVQGIAACSQAITPLNAQVSACATNGVVYVGSVGSVARRVLVVHGKPMDAAASSGLMGWQAGYPAARVSKNVLNAFADEPDQQDIGGWRCLPMLGLCWKTRTHVDRMAADVTSPELLRKWQESKSDMFSAPFSATLVIGLDNALADRVNKVAGELSVKLLFCTPSEALHCCKTSKPRAVIFYKPTDEERQAVESSPYSARVPKVIINDSGGFQDGGEELNATGRTFGPEILLTDQGIRDLLTCIADASPSPTDRTESPPPGGLPFFPG